MTDPILNAPILGSALKATPLLLLAWTATALLRKSSADLRHRIWLAALAGLALLMIPAPLPQAAQIVVDTPLIFYVATGAATVDATPFWGTTWTVTIWAAGVVLLMLRFFIGIVHLSHLTRSAQPSGTANVRISSAIATPLTWGIVQPAILLPEYAGQWSSEKVQITLRHEQAHIARRDWATQAAAQLLNAIFWFHPLVWLAAARLRQEAEQAVDDSVLASGAEPTSYAEQLLDVAKHVRTTSPQLAVAMVRRPILTGRVSAILDATRIRTGAGVWSRATIVVAALCLVPLLAAFQQASPVLAQLPTMLEPAFVQPSVPASSPDPADAFQSPVIAQADDRPLPGAFRPAQQPEPPAASALPAESYQQPTTPAPTAIPAEAPPEGTVFRIGGGVSAPVAIHTVEPIYTEEARRERFQGEVRVDVIIDELGNPTNIRIVKSLDPGLDAQAIASVSQWRFKPGLKDGKPVRTYATLAIMFRLL